MRRFRSPILFLAAMFVCAGDSRAQTKVPKADTESWNDVQLTIPLSRKVDFLIQGTVRIGDNLTAPVDERWGFGFNYRIQKYLTLNELYFHREATPPKGKHEYEDRLSFGATLNIPIGRFTISNRNWFERRWREPQVDAWRYRNRLQVEHPFQINKKKFTWFVSDEVFYDWSLHVWPRNRLSGGVSHPFNKHLTLELYYTRQNDSHTRPGDLNIIWSAWRIK